MDCDNQFLSKKRNFVLIRLFVQFNIIKNDNRKKSLISDYQFISVILSKYDYSPTQVWFINHVVNLNENSKFFKID